MLRSGYGAARDCCAAVTLHGLSRTTGRTVLRTIPRACGGCLGPWCDDRCTVLQRNGCMLTLEHVSMVNDRCSIVRRFLYCRWWL